MTAPNDIENTGDSNAVSVESTALFVLLESRHETMLQWCEPWPACGPEGNDLDAHVILRACVHDCINMQRILAKAAGRPTMGDDENHLLDFMAIHWARAASANDQTLPTEGAATTPAPKAGTSASLAVVVESSDDGGRSWEIHGIAWTTGEAARLAREIPWKWRLRKVALSDAGLIGWEETKFELAMMEKLESIFSANDTAHTQKGRERGPDRTQD